MSKAQLVITAVVLEGRSKSEVARDYDVSRTWVQQLVKRYETEGVAAFEPRSRRPHHNPRAVGAQLEEQIVRLRKTLDKAGFDAGAATIAEHLARDPVVTKVPATSTIWRILKRRGFVVPQPQKRPRCSWKRFQADLPNELWQADVTHWRLADHTEVEILDILDDHSRTAIASQARPVTTGPDVVDTFTTAFAHWGLPAGALTDNGAIFTAKQRGDGRTTLEITLGELGITYHHSRPYHPQTCGKVERFHQTLKKHLRALPPAATLTELQHQIDAFLAYYNHIRPHRALARRTPIQAFTDRPKAFPTGYRIPPHYRVRHDRIDTAGVITLRYNSRLHHIGLSKHLRGTRVTVLIDNLDIRVLHRDTGQLIRKLILDPTRDYQPRGVKSLPRVVSASRGFGTMCDVQGRAGGSTTRIPCGPKLVPGRFARLVRGHRPIVAIPTNPQSVKLDFQAFRVIPHVALNCGDGFIVYPAVSRRAAGVVTIR